MRPTLQPSADDAFASAQPMPLDAPGDDRDLIGKSRHIAVASFIVHSRRVRRNRRRPQESLDFSLFPTAAVVNRCGPGMA